MGLEWRGKALGLVNIWGGQFEDAVIVERQAPYICCWRGLGRQPQGKWHQVPCCPAPQSVAGRNTCVAPDSSRTKPSGRILDKPLRQTAVSLNSSCKCSTPQGRARKDLPAANDCLDTLACHLPLLLLNVYVTSIIWRAEQQTFGWTVCGRFAIR